MDDNVIVFLLACVMPVAIVLITTLSSMNKDKLRSKILMKAIEANGDLDIEKLAEAFQKPKKTPVEVLNKRLLYGCIFTFIGVFCGIIFALFSRKMGPGSANISFVVTATCLAIGLGFLVTYFVTRKQIKESSQQDTDCENLANDKEDQILKPED